MFQTALLLLTGPIRFINESISYYLKYASKNVGKYLYIKLEPEFSKPFGKSDVANLSRLSSTVPFLYNHASVLCNDLDVRIVLNGLGPSKQKHVFQKSLDVILTNSSEDDKSILDYVNNQFGDDCRNILKLEANVVHDDPNGPKQKFCVYDVVCLGGTFDHLHNGHKVLLSEAVMRATKKVIVGVTDVTILKKKVLWELIQPLEKRITDVSTFLYDIDQSLEYEVVPIVDPYGPTITNPDINAIIVSEETKLGGEKVNIERQKRNMKELSMHVVNLVEDFNKNPGEEDKLSSSTRRMHLLGTLLRKSEVIHNSNKPYCILLQGLPMCGKTCIANSFKALGLTVACCNEIIISILKQDSDLSARVDEILEDRSIFCGNSVNYKSLMTICLNDQDKRKAVSSLIFDKVECAIKKLIQEKEISGGTNILILKDSTLLCGKLKSGFIEIWTATLPVLETSKRLQQFYGFTDEAAAKVIKSIPSNEKFIKESNIVFSNQWAPSVTRQQVERAWSHLQKTLNL